MNRKKSLITIFLYNPFIISLNHILNSIHVKYITQVLEVCVYISYTIFSNSLCYSRIKKNKKEDEENRNRRNERKRRKRRRKEIML